MIRSNDVSHVRALGPLVAACCFALAPFGGAFAATTPGPAPPRGEMHQVFEAVTQLLPYEMDSTQWAHPANRKNIGHWLTILAERVVAVEEHAEKRDPSFRDLSRSLASNVEEIRARYELGRFEEARFFVVEMTGSCVACHARLPSERSFPMAQKLLDRIEFASLKPQEKTHLLVATRQFDSALAIWEQVMVDPSVDPQDLELQGTLLDYLIIGLRVQRAPERVGRTLENFLARGDLTASLHAAIRSWLRAIEATRADLMGEPDLARARALVDHWPTRPPASPLHPDPLSNEQTVYDLVASSLLLRLIDRGEGGDRVLAEAAYWLGLIEVRSIDSFWVPQADFHLERAIRLAPTAPFAEDAFLALGDYLTVEYAGATGGELPVDVAVRLRDLRSFLDAAKKGPAAPERTSPH